MNENIKIGNFIKQLRKQRNLSQEDVAKQCNYVRSYISMIENGERELPPDLVLALSHILQFDLNNFIENIANFETEEHYLLVYELHNLINTNDVLAISNILKTNKLFEEFDYGEPKIIKLYCQVLVLLHIEKNTIEAYNLLIEFLSIDLSNLGSYKLQLNMPEKYYSLFLNLVICLSELNEIVLCKNLCILLVNFLEGSYFNPNLPFLNVKQFYKRYYVTCLNNLAYIYFLLNDFENSFIFCNKGIEYSNKLNILSLLPQLCELKVDINYNLDMIQDSVESYQEFKYICRLTNNVDYFNKTTITFKNKYPKLFG